MNPSHRTPEPVPTSRAGRAWAHFQTAGEGIWGWVIGFALVACFGFWHLPQDLHDRNVANDLARNGVRVTANDVQVNLDKESNRHGGWWEVDRVRVHLPGNATATELEGVSGLDADLTKLPQEPVEGWQQPTPITGYTAPLQVRVMFNGDGAVLHAMAEADLHYWTVDNQDPEAWLGIGLSGLLLVMASLVANTLRARRLNRRRANGYLAPSQREPRGRGKHRG